jgi:L-alanine-DL-glutamate epimerase-like enolase superfamily enzyme
VSAARTIESVRISVFELPTERGPQSDGTLVWESTTMVLVECSAAGATGLGYTYAHASAARVVEDLLAPVLRGADPMDVPAIVARLVAAVRNHGAVGIAAMAISAVDTALWDLKARILDVPLAVLLGVARGHVPVYASGGFTSTSLDALGDEVGDYAARGFRRVKIKVGREPDRDLDRVRVARAAAGPDVELMVDANGAYARKQALAMAERFAEHGVVYFEEPIAPADVVGLRLLRDRAPAGMAIAAGEYGYQLADFVPLLDAVDILQADATRCLGISGFLRVDALCAARGMALSSHCAPALHAHAGAAAGQLVHLESFRDHVRFEARIFDGAPVPRVGVIAFDERRPGLGLVLRRAEVARGAEVARRVV